MKKSTLVDNATAMLSPLDLVDIDQVKGMAEKLNLLEAHSHGEKTHLFVAGKANADVCEVCGGPKYWDIFDLPSGAPERPFVDRLSLVKNALTALVKALEAYSRVP